VLRLVEGDSSFSERARRDETATFEPMADMLSWSDDASGLGSGELVGWMTGFACLATDLPRDDVGRGRGSGSCSP
jgi:hypothetical protein